MAPTGFLAHTQDARQGVRAGAEGVATLEADALDPSLAFRWFDMGPAGCGNSITGGDVIESSEVSHETPC